MRPFTYHVETLTWEECARAVQRCEAKNRNLSVKRVDRIARCVESRRFYMTHQGVAFDPAGNLIDGQHRLAAHARAKTDFVGLVCRYVDMAYAREVMAVFDSGRSRTTADGLAIGGTMPAEDSRAMTAVCNVLAVLMTGTSQKAVTLDVQEVADFFQAHRDSVRWCIGALPARRGGAYVRAAFALAWEVDHEKVSELAAQIDAGVGVPGSAAALWNRAHADGLLTQHGGREMRMAVALRALRILKAHVAGENAPAKLYTNEDSLHWFLTKLGAAPPEPAPASAPRVSDFEAEILKVIPEGGARLSAIAKAVKKSPAHVRHNLARLEAHGIVKRPEVGLYIRVAA